MAIRRGDSTETVRQRRAARHERRAGAPDEPVVTPADHAARFEPLYAAAENGGPALSWDSGLAHVLLREWVATTSPEGAGHRAVVVGSGYGRDAELIAGLGFETTAFDISPTAVAASRQRFPDTEVAYCAADLFALPPAWRQGFDLVLESTTVESLPVSVRARAISEVASLVAPRGTLIVLGHVADGHEGADGPPWPLTPPEMASFEVHGLDPVAVERLRDAGDLQVSRWRAIFRRR